MKIVSYIGRSHPPLTASAKSKASFCCACLCTATIAIVIISIVLFSIIHTTPLFQVRRLYIPALDKSLNASTDTSIIFDLYFKNRDTISNVYFDPINVTFYDNPNRNHSIANFTIPELTLKDSSQVGGDTKVKSGAVNATGLDLEGAKREIAATGFKVFHVSVETSVRYSLIWKTKRHAYRRDVGVKIGDTGAANLGREIFVWSRITLIFCLVIMFLSADDFYLN